MIYTRHRQYLVVKSRRMTSAGHVARMGRNINACRSLVGKPEGQGPFGKLGVDEIFKKIGG